MKVYFAYIRVSTAKQGEKGVSLQEQRTAIESYAARYGLNISRWFEERETAAKRGRFVFDRMMQLLRKQKADGVVIHKIDRGARNLRDWSDLGEMIDDGVDVHFANEALDLSSRGGRLSADIQAVVAADYIRNLCEEARKGMRGRYKQGLFPLPAPIGYMDKGGGQPKAIHPIQGQLVRRMFELYVSGRYTVLELTARMRELGLRTKAGGVVKKSVVARMLANPFYYGIVRLRTTGEIFEGRHKPLISQTLFRAVREVASQRTYKRIVKHDFPFRRILRCAECGYSLCGETAKGLVYYRCHTKTCPTNSIRDDRALEQLLEQLAPFNMQETERDEFRKVIESLGTEARQQREEILMGVRASLGNVEARMSRLADAVIDEVLDPDILREKQKALLLERNDLTGKLREIEERRDLMSERLEEFLDFSSSITTIFAGASPAIRLKVLRRIAGSVTVFDKRLTLVLHKAFQIFSNRSQIRSEITDGVPISEAASSNCDAHSQQLIDIARKNKNDRLAVECMLSGSPPQTSPRTLLLEIYKELILQDSFIQNNHDGR